MLRVCCIRAGEQFPPAYVNILFDSVRRNLAHGFEAEFVCFTDQPDDLAQGITSRPLPADLPGWWSKLALFKPGLFPEGDRVLYLDLANVITGRLDDVAVYDGPFAILRDFYRPDGLQSAVMTWRAGDCTDIWQSYETAGCPTDYEANQTWGDQAWIERTQLDAVRLQDKFPSLFASYKLTKGPPSKASVVVFHGHPKPHEVLTGWVPEVWKVGGLTRAELNMFCNTEQDRLIAHMRSAIARDVPWFDVSRPHDGHVCIVGGGPSLPDTLVELKWRASIGQKVWALNGTGRFLYKNGICPDVLVVADAREENAEFLGELNQGVELYLASQCHPELFEAAKDYDLPVTLWHVNSESVAELLANEECRPTHLIGGGSTVGMSAMALAYAAGYRMLHLYGFDSSYREDQHHAYPQSLNDQNPILDALYCDKKFRTTQWMVQQVEDFQALVPGLVADGCVITVAGTGLLQTVAADMAEQMPDTPAQIRAKEVLKRLNGAKHPRGAEIGVFAGEMSEALLRGNDRLHLDMIDSWEARGAAYQGNSGDFHAGLNEDAQARFRKMAIAKTQFAEDRRRIIASRSTVAAAGTDELYDFVFIDADHSYEGCKADIEAWASKVRPGGWLGGHDYENSDFPKFGVTRAVNEFVASNGLELELGDNFCWFVKIPTRRMHVGSCN